MWGSDKDKSEKKRLLPSSKQQLQHAKADRERAGAFHMMAQKWEAVVRPPVEEEAPPVQPNDPNMPAWLRHRPVGRAQPLFFRTKAVVRNAKPR
ncbi:MAG TPA: hypothetical protein VNR11_09765 [Xanthobacteraceae bacterium]|nr:hypothetical protein [Xanthobacteraceae bacterium]